MTGIPNQYDTSTLLNISG